MKLFSSTSASPRSLILNAVQTLTSGMDARAKSKASFLLQLSTSTCLKMLFSLDQKQSPHSNQTHDQLYPTLHAELTLSTSIAIAMSSIIGTWQGWCTNQQCRQYFNGNRFSGGPATGNRPYTSCRTTVLSWASSSIDKSI